MSFGWYVPNHFVVADDKFSDVEIASLQTGVLHVGVVNFHGVPWIVLRSSAFELFDAPALYLTGDAPPGIDSTDSHLVCVLYVVENRVTVGMRVFTLSAECTTVLRRLFAEQRARGPELRDRAMAVREQWLTSVHSAADAWTHVVAEYRVGLPG